MHLRDQGLGRRPFGTYLAGPQRQGRADFDSEVQVPLMTGRFPQALGDQRGGLGDVTAALRDPRAQER